MLGEPRLGHVGLSWGEAGLSWDQVGLQLGSRWGQLCVIRATLEAYVSHFDVEKLKMAHVMAR